MRGSTRSRRTRLLTGAVSVMAAIAWASGTSYAQQPGPPPPPPPAEPAPDLSGAPPAQPPPPPATAPAYAPPIATRPVQMETPIDHGAGPDLDVEARRWAIGYAGISQVPVGSPTVTNITFPALGIRYWTSPTIGVDVALGFGWTGGSIDAGGTSVDKDSVWGFILQGGLPIALSTHRHVSFQLIPFAAIAYGATSVSSGGTTGGSATDFSGTRVDVGARVGFELFFGFIGIPELALSATVGLQFEMLKYSANSAGLNSSNTSLGFATTVQNNPWDIFAGTVAARYYF
jgi:hypothetical protein